MDMDFARRNSPFTALFPCKRLKFSENADIIYYFFFTTRKIYFLNQNYIYNMQTHTTNIQTIYIYIYTI